MRALELSIKNTHSKCMKKSPQIWNFWHKNGIVKLWKNKSNFYYFTVGCDFNYVQQFIILFTAGNVGWFNALNEVRCWLWIEIPFMFMLCPGFWCIDIDISLNTHKYKLNDFLGEIVKMLFKGSFKPLFSSPMNLNKTFNWFRNELEVVQVAVPEKNQQSWLKGFKNVWSCEITELHQLKHSFHLWESS